MRIQSALSSALHPFCNRVLVGTLAAIALMTPSVLAAPLTVVQGEQTVELNGVSGGPSLVSDCAAVLPEQASQEIQLSEAFIQQSGFLKFILETDGSPVLVLDGPAGRFCSLGDSAANQQPEVAGYWLPGVYRVYVGDRSGISRPYKLSILRAEN